MDLSTTYLGMRLPHPLLRLLYDWYLAGWLRIGERHE